jgi:hypothetical protein
VWKRYLGTAAEAVDAAGPVDAQNAPTGPWKTADGFHERPPPSSFSGPEGERENDKGVDTVRDQPATIMSSAAGNSGAPCPNPSAA